MAKHIRFMNDGLRTRLEPLLPKPKRRHRRLHMDNPETLEDILWIVHTGARWKVFRKGTSGNPHDILHMCSIIILLLFGLYFKLPSLNSGPGSIGSTLKLCQNQGIG